MVGGGSRGGTVVVVVVSSSASQHHYEGVFSDRRVVLGRRAELQCDGGGAQHTHLVREQQPNRPPPRLCARSPRPRQPVLVDQLPPHRPGGEEPAGEYNTSSPPLQQAVSKHGLQTQKRQKITTGSHFHMIYLDSSFFSFSVMQTSTSYPANS